MDLRSSLNPATGDEIAGELERMMIMFWDPGRTETDDVIRNLTWLKLLEDYPADAISAACLDWMRTGKWMARPADLIEKIERIVNMRKALIRRAERLLAEPASKATKPQPVRSEPDPDVAAGFEDLLKSIKPKRMDEA